MNCKKCGTELRENDVFCYYCGTKTTVIQRIFSSRAIVGSIIAIVIVAVAGLLTYFIMTGKLKLPQRAKEPVVEEHQQKEPHITPPPEQTAESTATPYVFQPADVTAEMKKEMKDLLGRLKPFLSYSASFYFDGSHAFQWNDKTATVLALYNLEHNDKTVRYGNDIKDIKKKTEKEMKALFDKNYKYKLEYGGSYPNYVYRPVGNTIVFNATRIPGKDYSMETKKIIEYEEGRYRIVVDACLKSRTSGSKGDVQRYTIMADKKEGSKHGYVVSKIRLYKKNDMKVSG